jgi:SAM-dependent methyltransferase
MPPNDLPDGKTCQAQLHTELPFSPAAERNAPPLLAQLRQWLPPQAQVLEVASGTGQHAAHFAAAEAGWQWQPTDLDAAMLPAIAARCAGLPNVAMPLPLDVLAPALPQAPHSLDAVLCANMLHIAPWACTPALMQLAARLLKPGGLLLTYGPYVVDGEPLAPSNAAFDTDLKARNATWGLRTLAQVQAEAGAAGLQFVQRTDMPAHNLLLVWRR